MECRRRACRQRRYGQGFLRPVESMSVNVAFNLYPFVEVRVLATPKLDLYIAAMNEFVEGLAKREGRFTVLTTVAPEVSLDANLRSASGEIMKLHESLFVARCDGWGVVLNLAMQRGIVTAVAWIAGPRYPMKPFSSRVDARRWLEEVSSSRGSSSLVEAPNDLSRPT